MPFNRLGHKIYRIFAFAFFAVIPGAVLAQCPSNPVLTPTAWGGGSGSATFNGSVYTLSGVGTYSNGQPHENGFADLRPMATNLQIQARVVSETGFSGSDTAAAIFIKDNPASSADGAVLWLESPGGAHYLYADRAGGGNLIERLNGSASIPYWIRLQNWGGVVTPSISPDGITWTQLGSFDLTAELGSGTLTCGLAVWSGSSSQATTVKFDNVCVSSFTPVPTPTPAGVQTSVSPPGARVWPNPFTPTLPPNDRTHFLLTSSHGSGSLLLADLKRRKVRQIDFQAGADVQWDGKDENGAIVSSGVYLYLLEADGSMRRGTITVMR